jgi:hypothetical protein
VTEIQTQKSLFELASAKYDLHSADLYGLGSVRKGGKIPLMINVPVVIYQSTLNHRILVVALPGQLGLFSPAVLEGHATAGGLEALERRSHSKLASLFPLGELSLVPPRKMGFLRGAAGLVVPLHHSSGTEFTINTLSPELSHRIRTAVSG